MNRREAKAVELIYSMEDNDYNAIQDVVLEAMQWMAEECANQGWLQDQGEAWSILNAGLEDAV